MKLFRIRYTETVTIEATFLCGKNELSEDNAWEELQNDDSATYSRIDATDRVIDEIQEQA